MCHADEMIALSGHFINKYVSSQYTNAFEAHGSHKIDAANAYRFLHIIISQADYWR